MLTLRKLESWTSWFVNLLELRCSLLFLNPGGGAHVTSYTKDSHVTLFSKDNLLLLHALGVDRGIRILGGLLVLLDAWMWSAG